MLYTLDLYSAVCQLYSIKLKEKKAIPNSLLKNKIQGKKKEKWGEPRKTN